MKTFRKTLHSRFLAMALGLAASATLFSGCAQSQAAREIRTGYAADTYLQSVEAAHATRSLARELLHKDSPETVRQRLESELRLALEAARTDGAGRMIQDPAVVQKRTVQAVVWYEDERQGLERWYSNELAKIDTLAQRIEASGEAAVRASEMADRELEVSSEALRSFLKTGLPQIAGEALDEYLRTRNATEVVQDPQPEDTPEPTSTH